MHAANAAASPRLDLAWIADHDMGQAARVAERHGARPAGVDQILADGEVRGVLIAASSDSLLDLALAAHAAGKTVFVEKPLSLSVERLRAAVAEMTGSGVFVAFNRRFDPSFAALKAKLDDGAIGALETLHLVNHDPQAPDPAFIPRSGGLFRDFTVHDFDTARWLLGEPIVRVFAWASCLVDPAIGALGDVDTAKLILTSASGRLCMISNSRRSGYGYDQRIEAFGSGGALRVGNLHPNGVEQWGESGSRAEPIHYAFPDRYRDAYRLELDHFADMMENGAAPSTSVGDALEALLLAEAAALSARSGQPIDVSAGKEICA